MLQSFDKNKILRYVQDNRLVLTILLNDIKLGFKSNDKRYGIKVKIVDGQAVLNQVEISEEEYQTALRRNAAQLKMFQKQIS